ncbi:hypothetical protein FHT78_002758 [Rhizobium sp. BK196]|nr:hypothetical protein [Rhizobium sp. BK196]MBB3460027.1 hypothetical protein [Rhizobium sp. BK377]
MCRYRTNLKLVKTVILYLTNVKSIRVSLSVEQPEI